MKIIFCLHKRCNIILQTFGSGWQGFRLPAQRFAARSFRTQSVEVLRQTSPELIMNNGEFFKILSLPTYNSVFKFMICNKTLRVKQCLNFIN